MSILPEEGKEFGISKEELDKLRRLINPGIRILFLTLVILASRAWFFEPAQRPIVLIGLLFVSLVFFILPRIVFAGVQQARLILTTDSLIYVKRHQKKEIKWNQIESISVNRNPRGDIHFICLKFGKAKFYITLFEKKEEILRLLEKKVKVL